MSLLHDQDVYFTTINPLIRFVEKGRMSTILRAAHVRCGERALDVGCGNGNLLEAMGRGERSGIDLSLVMVRRAAERLGTGARILHMDGAAMAFPDASFDKVVCSEVLEHVLDPSRVVQEIRRVLVHNGIAVVSIPQEWLIKKMKYLCQFLQLSLLLRLTSDGTRTLMPIENPWHLHDASLTLFHEWNAGVLHVEKVQRVLAWCPFHYVITLRKL